MHAIIVRTTVPMLLVLTLALSFTGEPPTPQASSAVLSQISILGVKSENRLSEI